MSQYVVILVMVLCVWLFFYVTLGDKLTGGEMLFVAAASAVIVWAVKAAWDHFRGKEVKKDA